MVPNENQCAGCHVVDLKTKQIAPIGPKARHLNRDFDFASGHENQLSHLAKIGYLSGIPDLSSAPQNADWRNSSAPVDARARAYLDINCGHCHNANGPANTTALDLTIFGATDRHLGLCKPPVAAGRGTGDHLAKRDDAGAGAHHHARRRRCTHQSMDFFVAGRLRYGRVSRARLLDPPVSRAPRRPAISSTKVPPSM